MQESLDASLVRIHTANGGVVGAGFLVGERQILTCAHVVVQALGLTDQPSNPPQGLVSVDFPLVAPRTPLTARVVLWRPVLSDGSGDISCLELQHEPPVGAEVVQFALAEDVWEHPFRALGFPASYDDGVWATGRLLGRQATGWVMIEDMKTQGFAVGPGFSGTPVWDTQLQGVVGMVVAASRSVDTKAAFVIPQDLLVAAWPQIEPFSRPRIFLSLAPADAAFADRLCADLEARGIVVWNEQRTPGEDHAEKEERVRQAIRAAQMVVVVVSSQARSSRTVKEHLHLADLYARRLILVGIGDEEDVQAPPPGWRETVWIDAHGPRYAAALDTIEATLVHRRSISALLGPSHATAEEEIREPRNPYKGLRAFTEEDAGDFFGRDHPVNELVNDVAGMVATERPASNGQRLLTIIGSSGSGKSSVVMAGLMPRLQQGAVPGSEAWVYLEAMLPGRHPIEALGLTLAPCYPDRSFASIREDLEDDATRGLHVLAMQLVKQRGTRVVLLVDQFEELFTQTESEDERRRFIELLLTATTEPRGPLLVLLTLRADFYDRLMCYPALYQLVDVHHRSILPMEVDDLRATIEQPAALPDVQLTFEGNLIGDLLFEVRGQAGALPLLQFTLAQLFERRNGHRLTLSAYREIGGVRGALAKHAEKTYAALPSEERRRLAYALFVRLIDPGMTEQDTTRRRATLSEFSLDDAVQTRQMQENIDAFVQARLLTTNEVGGTTTIEVSHEALIREWPRLREWLREAREDIHLQQKISADAADWVQRGKPADRVYRGTELAEAEAWAERNVPSTDEVAFLQASVAERQYQENTELNQKVRELTLQRRVVSRQRLIVVALSIFTVIVIVLASVAQLNYLQAEVQRKNAEMEKHIALEQASNAQSRALAASANASLAQKQLDRALLLSVKASQTADTYEARDSLLSTLMYSPHIITTLHLRLSLPYSYPVNSLAFSANGDLLFSADDNDVFVWNTKTKKSDILSPVGSRHPNYISQIAVSRNDQLATLGPDGVWLWNARTGEQLAQLEGNDTKTRPSGIIGGLSLAFSPDGRLLAVGQCQQFTSTGNSAAYCGEAQIFLWDTASKKRIGSPFNIPNTEINSVAFSPDGKILASGSDDGAVRLWDVSTGSLIGSPFTASAQPVSSVAFSPDGKTLASGNGDGIVRLWNVAAGTLLQSLVSENRKNISSVAFNPDGKTLASGSDDGAMRLWNISTGSLIGSPFTASAQPVSSIAFSPDGKTLASGNDRDTVGLWNMGANSTITQRLEYTRGLHSAVFSRDGKTLVTGSEDGKVVLWDIAQEKTTAILDTSVYPTIEPKQGVYGSLLSIQSLAISGDGRMIAAGRLDGLITLWDMKTKLPLAHFIHPNPLGKIIFGQDGRILASLSQSFSNETKVVLWDATTGTIIRSLPITYPNGYNAASSFSFSPDGKLLAIGICGQWDKQQRCMQGQILLWDAMKGKFSNIPLPGLTDQVFDVAFSPDGRTLAASGPESILLLDMTTKKAIGQPLSFSLLVDTTSNVVGYYQHITFSPDGRFLMSYGSAGSSLTDDVFILWDRIKHEPFAHAFHTDSSLDDLIFYPNEQKLASVGSLTSGKGAITLWDITIASWQAHACSIANRNFIMSEWKQFFTDQPYSKVCPNLPIDSSVTQDLLDQAHTAVLTGDTQAASSAYMQAAQVAMEGDDPSVGNNVCRSGSLDQFAKEVLPACEYAVKLDPNNVNYHDSRALARALAGDTKGAIADYRFVVQPSNGYGGLTSEQIKERTSWLRALEAGHSPFDAKTLKILQNE